MHERKRILVLDDDVLLAIDLAEQLSAAGYDIIGPAYTVDEARASLKGACDFAVIDAQVGAETSAPIADILRSAAIPFVVLSGYTQLGSEFAGGLFLRKPLRITELIAALDLQFEKSSRGVS